MVLNGYDTGNESGKIGWKNLFTKPIEIYVFIDPLYPDCWALEPILKKLLIEYGDKFSIRHVLTGRLTSLNITKTAPSEIAKVWERTASRSGMSCDGDVWFEDPLSTPYAASIAVKAAELQGKKSGLKFLRKLQEWLFLDKQNITKEDVLIQLAKETMLDIHEFKSDLHSETAAKAFQCDLKITREMDVEESPTLVFFNNINVEEEGIKLTGSYPYEIYVQVLSEILQRKLNANTPPPIEEFLSYFKFVATKEIAVVYNISCQEVEKQMKKLLLKQSVERVPVKYGTFWRYLGE
ncbi:ClpXP adapter SpxH family protein [Calidifontibacillus oryziterrae]|uniref:ClpXP adapter SpxH family protein n=1 Tax=Calidifontibacillus oryziterrae TaxID=1191699 RepID=UPI0002D937E5|nr:ClpXP adapter SpxH family protein [Calidifontibacillus oryziterrae]